MAKTQCLECKVWFTSKRKKEEHQYLTGCFDEAYIKNEFDQAWNEERVCLYCGSIFDSVDVRDMHLMKEEAQIIKEQTQGIKYYE